MLVKIALETLVVRAPQHLQKMIRKLSQIETKTLTLRQRQELDTFLSDMRKKSHPMKKKFVFISEFTTHANLGNIRFAQQAA